MGDSPVAWAFNGRGVDLEGIGGIAAYEVGFMGQLAIPGVALVLGIGLTRRLEQAGVLELVTAYRVSRCAVPGSALLVALGSWVLFALVSAAGLALLDVTGPGVVAYPTLLALFGLAFTGVGVLAGQLAQDTRGASALASGVVLAAFVVRMVVDGRRLDGLDWVSPMSWLAAAHPWGEWVWWPALAFLALAMATAVASLLVAARRDLGSGVLPHRAGREEASRFSTTLPGLAWRLTRAGVVGWALATVAWGAAVGSMAAEMDQVVADNPALAMVLGGTENLEAVFALLVSGILAAAAGVSGTSRLGAEEAQARLGLVLAGAVPRWRLWVAWTGVAAVVAVAVLVLSALALGLSQWIAGEPVSVFGTNLRAAAGYAPAVLVVVGLAGLLTALSPRLRSLAWLPIGWALVVALLGEALRLPRWARDLSPFELIGRLPVDQLDQAVWVTLLAGAIVVAALGAWRFATRSLAAG